MSGQKSYLVLGCNDVGFEVASRLERRGVMVVDKNVDRVEQLKRIGYDAVVGDFGSPETLQKAGIESAKVVVISTPEFSKIKRALGAINQVKAELNICPLVLALVRDEAEVGEARWLGASVAVPRTQALVEAMLKGLHEGEAIDREKRLRGMLKLRGKLAIVLRDGPGPDDIASGVAMKLYAKAFGVDTDVVYAGSVDQQLEQTMMRHLELEFLSAERVKFEDYAGFALIGVATHTNCALPRDILPTIVIDNHLVPLGEVRARFCDVRLVGATSTLLTNYLRHAAVELDKATATALTIGILSSTQGFTKGATPLDLKALEYLLPWVNTDLLRRTCADENATGML